MTAIDTSHLGRGSGNNWRTVLAQLGPLQTIKRLAGDQKLRMGGVRGLGGLGKVWAYATLIRGLGARYNV